MESIRTYGEREGVKNRLTIVLILGEIIMG